ncbi:NAD-dependent succinate-semialdehyde dehydrogenase [Burkholderia sp. Ac-20379]|uniref:NAD-dependent succinate-semialdehyde dehydrogenase n=1 Tax=Burkholderia sp. Ac-20379 TaxID=2703900 RepID=UPI00198118CA|nr:NAD-dependent succinate-semialdehyde dehydrogenase [Burkholderia sp. Ac-20379]MBN3725353.1 NAD-dependent succinate-semialdehyde dehydrogenase [Burkholderia sp. Ac-20379]
MAYHDVNLFIDGEWRPGAGGQTLDVTNPATGARIGAVARAETQDVELAIQAAQKGFVAWRGISAFERAKTMRNAASLVRERADAIATLLTTEEGKPLAEARMEVNSVADLLDWFADEARRVYGRVIPGRQPNVMQTALKEPVGPAIGFTPWNFPVAQIMRKVAPALAAGCSIIVKAPEETPASPAALIQCFHDAGVPAGTIGLLFGVPAEISEYAIPHPGIRKVSFTGSVPIGKQLAALASRHMKRATMELGGHAPVIVCEDADLESAATLLAGAKFRNAGQVCVAPTRFLIARRVYAAFCDKFAGKAAALKVGDGLADCTTMGPLINERRLQSVERLVDDAVAKGARLLTGGKRLDGPGHFYAPTVLADVTTEMDAMNDEPFGPIALLMPFDDLEDALREANRLPFGLASYAWTRDSATASTLARGIEAGMLTINHLGLALPETPYGGIRESGIGSEGGPEAVEAYLNTKFVSHLNG